jgi:hypothetical protein
MSDAGLAAIFVLNVGIAIANHNWCSLCGWAAALSMLERVHFG